MHVGLPEKPNPVDSTLGLNEEYQLETSMDSNTLYFVMQGEEVRGPYTLDFIEGMILSGLVRPDTQVYLEGGSEWLDIRNVLRPSDVDEANTQGQSQTSEGISQGNEDLSREELQAKLDRLQAELVRRQKIKAIEEDTAQKLAQIELELAQKSKAVTALAQTPFGIKMLTAINAFNNSRPPGTNSASVFTLTLASDISPLADPNAELQPHTASYIPVAYAIEQLNLEGRCFASAFLKRVSGRELKPAEQDALIGYQPDGKALVRADMNVGLVPTGDGLEYIKQLVPVADQIGMLTAGKSPIIPDSPTRRGGFFGFFRS